MDELKRRFGPIVGSKAQEDSPAIEVGARLLYVFLSNSKWRALDE
jgi:hypothetical protein